MRLLLSISARGTCDPSKPNPRTPHPNPLPEDGGERGKGLSPRPVFGERVGVSAKAESPLPVFGERARVRGSSPRAVVHRILTAVASPPFPPLAKGGLGGIWWEPT